MKDPPTPSETLKNASASRSFLLCISANPPALASFSTNIFRVMYFVSGSTGTCFTFNVGALMMCCLSSSSTPGMEIPTDGQSKKIQALWITLHQAGKVRDGSDKALMAFAKRMTKTKDHPGKDHLKFCDKQDKWKIIEALKDWAKRENVDVG